MSETSFPPLLPDGMHTLILGSAPSKRSLAQQEYYAHPGNAFWPLVHSVYQVPLSVYYPEKIALLQQHRIGLWDVFAQFERKGSLDANITSGTWNDLATVIARYPLSLLILNGQAAAKTYEKVRTWPEDYLVLRCPSTSGANNRQKAFRQTQWTLAYHLASKIDDLAQNGFHLRYGSHEALRANVAKLREAVFVFEQHIPYDAEFDSKDQAVDTTYFLIEHQNKACATIRFQAKNHSTIEPDRFCVAQAFRKQQLGRTLLQIYEWYAQFLGFTSSELDAETTAVSFYHQMGYQICSAPYLVDGISCVRMQKELR